MGTSRGRDTSCEGRTWARRPGDERALGGQARDIEDSPPGDGWRAREQATRGECGSAGPCRGAVFVSQRDVLARVGTHDEAGGDFLHLHSNDGTWV